jgi:hypothetical protein
VVVPASLGILAGSKVPVNSSCGQQIIVGGDC